LTEKTVDFLEEAGLTPSQRAFIKALVSQPRASVLFGGSGYCGKTRTLCVAAVFLNGYLASLGFPGMRGFIGCMNYTQLTDRIVPQMRELYGHLGEVKESRLHGWHFAFNDQRLGVICFRNLSDPNHRKGSGFAYILIDEITELLRKEFGETLYFRLQRTQETLPFMPLGAASNPDGIGHSWVKSLWVPGYQDFSGDNRDFKPSEFVFIPARPEENPKFDEDAFNTATAGLSDAVKKARREGSWATPEGARWPTLGRQHQFSVSQKFPYGIPEHYTRILAIDYGLRAPYCALWIAIDGEGDAWVFQEDYKAGITADVQAERMMNLTEESVPFREIRADPAIWAQLPGHQGPSNKSILDIYNDVLRSDPRFKCGFSQGYNKSRSIAMATLDTLFNQENGLPNLYIEEGCKHLWGELTGAVWDTRGQLSGKKEDIDPRNPDHAITALYYGLHTWYEMAPNAPPPVSQEAWAKQKEVEHFERYVRENTDFDWLYN